MPDKFRPRGIEQEPGTPNLSEKTFKAYVEGNSRIPLNLTGTRIFVIASIFEDPNFDWDKFSNSHFSAEQIAHLRKLSSRMHAKRNIPEQDIEDRRLQNLWYRTKTGVQDNLIEAIEWVDPIHSSGRKLESKDLEAFFSEQGNKKYTDEIKGVVSMLKEALHSDQAGELFNQWRGEFDHSKPENVSNNHGTWNRKHYSKKFEDLVKQYCKKIDPRVSEKLINILIS